jgi:hypothetical protein
MTCTLYEYLHTFMTTLVTNLIIFTFVTTVTNISVVTLAAMVTFDTRL